MPFLPPFPLLFADADAIVTIIAIVIGIISWIIKVISNAKQAGPPVAQKGRAPVRPRDDRLSQEISIFLEESAKPGADSRPSKAPARPAQRPPPAAAKSAKRRPAAAPPEQPAKKPPRRLVPGEEVASRHLEPKRDLGDTVRKHVQEHLADNVAKEVSQHLKSRIGESVAEHLGTSGTPAPSSAPPTSKAQSLVQSLRNPETLRQGMIINLILSRPRSLERK